IRCTTISPSFSSCHMASRTSSTRSFCVSIERLSTLSSTQEVAIFASTGERLESRHSGPWPVNRSVIFRVLLLFEEVLPVLALLVHDVRDHVVQVLVDALKLLEDPGHFPDRVELDRSLEVDFPGRGRGVERRQRDRLAQELERRLDLRDVRSPVGEMVLVDHVRRK